MEGRPAESAGLRIRDIVVGMGGQVIGNIDDCFYAFARREAGTAVEAAPLHNGRRVTLTVNPSGGE